MSDFISETQLRAELDRVWNMLYCERDYVKQLQARIDELMFEHCPEEMTEEQLEEYRRNLKVMEE